VRINPWQTGNRGETIRYRPPTEKGKVFEKLEQVGFFCVADCRKYNLYFIICSNLGMSERLPPGRFTKEQSFSRADNFENIKSSISDPPICDRPYDTNYVIDHTYALPIATEPYIIDSEPFSIYSEIEVNTEVDAVQNEVIFDYIH
jgi:hypothetical protein